MIPIYTPLLDDIFSQPTVRLQTEIQEEINDFNTQLKNYLSDSWDIQTEEAPIDKFAGRVSIYKKENSQIKFPIFSLAIENNYYILTSEYLTTSLFCNPFTTFSMQRKIKNKKDLQKALINIIKSPEFMRLLRGLEI